MTSGAMVAFRGLTKRIGAKRHLLFEDVTLDLPWSNVGLLGRNGAGKSSLLRLIAGTLTPDRGRIAAGGRVSWPLGFAGSLHPALTGLQNTRFVARVHGLDTAETADRVAAFAEIGAHFRQPVAGYSTGMRARLAFGISLAAAYDIYLVDEIIGVGDQRFRAKCRAAFVERIGQAHAVIVSHDPGVLREFCESGLVLEHGQLSHHPDLDAALARHRAAMAHAA